jgi:hypothetical protein
MRAICTRSLEMNKEVQLTVNGVIAAKYHIQRGFEWMHQVATPIFT